ncbi:beta-lactamase domain protein [Beutenbergia cavernae DSM 12333]|uniref:Linear primary-alkylsulfatase n=1 Tax=Beutenbergia cavernae (strain ATCC BAA-8 / DSM 12333 / CCUG 43141 / JCM 11478 / NBRC 16432 / NCIMB 13614 / HKI 0122) TaxID=471853 RepID=C5BYP7_BEUC1|nr:alkyl sulfatase dimerization domain-containing protein [Beutenbergia cavernae]ACQ79005.1 beta-lactamase domain protein [Beutenbergia cavernae DSM 12333]
MTDPVSAAVASAHAEAARTLPFSDDRDHAATGRGLLAPLSPDAVRTSDGREVWDVGGYAFLDGKNPGTVHPSLWRQSGLVTTSGLFQVVPGIYQVRGLDLSNVTFVEGDRGVVVIDPLISVETAAAALALYREHRGDRPVTGVVYTHSHVDHFGGVKGVTTQEDVDAGRCVVLAPAGFLEHAIAENVYAGTAMARRAGYMYGAALEKGAAGQVGAGLGQTTSTGTVSLIVPTVDVTRTGQREVVDGVTMEFQLTPGTEAPSEMNFLFPDLNALCMAENATHTLHNTLTLRGALVRDPHVWAVYLTEAIRLFAHRADVVFASHHWPTWGREDLTEFLSQQRDLYAYLHDQTLRMINQGYVGREIAERIQLPPALEHAWHARGYYGSVSHNVKAIYQRYMGWFDGNPAHLWEHPPVEEATRYVAFMGGADAVVAKARDSFDDGDLRWVVTVLNHVLFADPDHAAARELQAAAYTQLGYGSENGTWRNFFLSGAEELRHGSFGTPTQTASPDLLGALTPAQALDSIAIRVDGPRSWDVAACVDWVVDGTRFRVRLANGVLVHDVPREDDEESPEATFTTDKATFLRALLAPSSIPELVADGSLQLTGDGEAWTRVLGTLDETDPGFAIVLP